MQAKFRHAAAGGARPRVGRRRARGRRRRPPRAARATTSCAARRCSAASAPRACPATRTRAPTPTASARRREGTPRLRRGGRHAIGQFARLGGVRRADARARARRRDASPTTSRSTGPRSSAARVLTGTGAVFRTAQVEPGSTVAVIGAGGIGLAAIQGARIAGAGAGDRRRRHRRTSWHRPARSGATADGERREVDDVVAAVRDLTGGGVDYSFEAIGAKPTAEQAYPMLRPAARRRSSAWSRATRRSRSAASTCSSGGALQGSMMGSNRFRIDIPRLLDMYRDGRLLLDEVISERIDARRRSTRATTSAAAGHGDPQRDRLRRLTAAPPEPASAHRP